MAVRYSFEAIQDGETRVVQRRLLIPESPEENLRGDTYDQDNIDLLHESEQGNIAAEVGRLTRLATSEGKGEVTLGKVWYDTVDGDDTPTPGALRRLKEWDEAVKAEEAAQKARNAEAEARALVDALAKDLDLDN